MWECKQCGYKNNNSTKKCHGDKCKGIKEYDAIKIPSEQIKKEKKIKRVYDYCPACKKDMFFTPTIWRGHKAWSCESHNHRPCIFSGKSKPIPEVII